MAYMIDWGTKVVTIPKADMTFISDPPDVRELDLEDLWTNLIALQESEDGMMFDDIVANTAPFTVGPTTFARLIQIINGYTITFEDGPYAVNIVGGNSNLSDVINRNQVSYATSNSGGLVVGEGADPVDVANAVLATAIEVGLDLKNALRLIAAATAGKISGAGTGTVTIRSAKADDKDRIVATVDGSGNRTAITYDETD